MESQHVVCPTSAGPVLGQIVQESATGTVTVRTPEGAVVECKLEGRPTPVADPQIFGPVPFVLPLSEEPASAIETLLTLFREECKTADDRRSWAIAHGAPDLADEKDVDELLKFRYEQHRSEWKRALKTLLTTAVGAGNPRLLLAALEQSTPMDARRVATEVAIAAQAREAIPMLCAAAIHKTQTAFASEAARALSILAPERLPLISRAASAGNAGTIDLSPAHALPESRMIARAIASRPHGAEHSQAAVHATEPLIEHPDTLVHLAAALPVADQMCVLQWVGGENDRAAIADSLCQLFNAVSEKDSPTGYEQILRTALAQLVLANTSDRIPSEVRETAARVVARDAELDALCEMGAELPEGSAARLVRSALANAKSDRASTLISSLAIRRPSLAALLGATLRSAIKTGQLEPSLRVAVLRLLCFDPESHVLVAREAGRELGRLDAEAAADLARGIAKNAIPVDVQRMPPAGRAAIIRALGDSSASYAAAVLDALRHMSVDEMAWSSLNELVLPDDWVAQDARLRDVLIAWLPIAVRHDVAPAMHTCLIAAVELDAPDAWAWWSASVRDAAHVLLATAPPVQAASILATVAARLARGEPMRAEVIARLVDGIISRAPDAIDISSTILPEDELCLAVLARGSTVEAQVAERMVAGQRARVEETQHLATDLRAELERAMRTLGPDDQLRALLHRLADDIAAAVPREQPIDSDIVAYSEEFGTGPATDVAAGRREEALLSLLRRLGGRSRCSPSALVFFRARAAELLQTMTRTALEKFIEEQRRVLDRLDLAAIELVGSALLRAGADPTFVSGLLGNEPNVSSVVSIALSVSPQYGERAMDLLRASGVALSAVTAAIAALVSEYRELTAEGSAPANGIVDLARRVSSTMEAIDGLMLNYMRIRQVFTSHGLMPVEPVLGATRAVDDLVPGSHRIAGLGITSGSYEVLTQGFKLVSTGDVVVPAAVARRAEPSDRTTGQDT